MHAQHLRTALQNSEDNELTVHIPRAAERGGQEGGGSNCPEPPGSGAPYKLFVGPQSFFWVKYFRAKGMIFGFWGAK